MTLKGEITSLETTGDQIEVAVQASEVSAAFWRPTSRVQFQVADTKTNRRALHIGRAVTIKVTLR